MAKSIGNIYAELSVRDKMTVGLKRAQKSLVSFGKIGLKSGAAIGTALATGMAIGTKRAIGLVDSLGDLSSQAGIAVNEMAVLQRAYQDGGNDASKASKDIARMQKTISGVATGLVTVDPFASMGLSAEKLLKLSPAKQMEEIGKAIMEIENPTLRNAKAMEIFGKSGSSLTTVFGTIEAARKSLGRMPVVAELYAKQMDEANDIMGHMTGKLDAFFIGFSTGIINDLLPALKEIDAMDFTGMGQAFGRFTSDAMKETKELSSWIESLSPQSAVGGWLLGKFTNGAKSAVENQDLSHLPQIDLDKRQMDALNKASATSSGVMLEDANAPGALPAMLTKDFSERAREFGATMEQYQDDLNKAEAAATGDSAIVKSLENEIFLREKIQELIEGGFDNTMAQQAAQDLLTAQLAADATELQKKKDDAGLPDIGELKATTAGINDMQARGFGMGAEGMVAKVDQQLNVLEQIRDELKKKRKVEGAVM